MKVEIERRAGGWLVQAASPCGRYSQSYPHVPEHRVTEFADFAVEWVERQLTRKAA